MGERWGAGCVTPFPSFDEYFPTGGLTPVPGRVEFAAFHVSATDLPPEAGWCFSLSYHFEFRSRGSLDAAFLQSMPARFGLHARVMALPSAALPEAEEQLEDLKVHYQKLEAAKARPALPPARREARAVVTGRVSR
ncbi:MAG: hypothetical protein QME96_01480 [Myxococcota bacterium]|nr:hypothetical protein [Myxococcota bacterium]